MWRRSPGKTSPTSPQLRLHIEIDALRRSIRFGDDAWRAQLQRAYDDISAFEQPIRPELRKRWELLNTRFHEALVAACASPWTFRVMRLLARHSERYRNTRSGCTKPVATCTPSIARSSSWQ